MVFGQFLNIVTYQQTQREESMKTRHRKGQNEQTVLHLPRDEAEKQKLADEIKECIHTLKMDQQPAQQKIKTLQLRLRLIEAIRELTEIRLDHLQQIFKHYCTHIFKTGKHMTFDRLEYEKIHLTMDRLFVFLKDFELTHREIDGKSQELVEKNAVVRLFKKLSSNCRDMTFEEFVACLERIATIYYDSKDQYILKLEVKRKERDSRIEVYRRKIKEKEQEKAKKRIGSQERGSSPLSNSKSSQGYHSESAEGEEKQENDDLVNEMMQDSTIKNANEEVEAQVQKTLNQLQELEDQQQKEADKKEPKKKAKESLQEPPKSRLDQLLELTEEEKIEYFYRIINVDSINDFRRKMSKLNLPIFGLKERKVVSKSKMTKEYELRASEIHHAGGANSHRVVQLRDIMEERRIKQRERQLMDRLSKERQEEILERQYKKETVKEEHLPKGKNSKSKKKAGILDGELSLNMINRLSANQLKIKSSFNPFKFFSIDDDDQKFMGEFLVDLPQNRTSDIIGIKLQSRSVAQKTQKRAEEIELKQRAQQKKFSQIAKKHYNYRSHKVSNRL